MTFSVRSYIMGPDMTESAYFWSATGKMKVSLLLTVILSWEIWYIMTRRASVCPSSRLCHLRYCNISPILDVFPCLLVTYLESLRWTIFILFMSILIWGSYTEQAYSSDGLTNNVYACSLTEVELIFKLPSKKPKLLLALPQW
jgi:hypothetical protein